MNKRSFLVSFIVFLFLVQEAFAYVSIRGATSTFVYILDEVSRFICVLLGIPCYSFHTFLIGFLIPMLLVYAMFFGILTAVDPFGGSSWNVKLYQIISLLLAAMMFLVANKYTRIFEWLITNGTGIVAIILYAGLFFLMIAFGFYHFYIGGAKYYKTGFQDLRRYNDTIRNYKDASKRYNEISNDISRIDRRLTRLAFEKESEAITKEVEKLTSLKDAKLKQLGSAKALMDGWDTSSSKIRNELLKRAAGG